MSIRQEKIESLLKRDVGAFFQQNGNTYCPGGMITVTVLRITADLTLAKVYVSIFKAEDKNAVIDAINADTSRVRGEMGKAFRKVLRIIPTFKFYLDDSLDYAEKIDSILRG
ncbi:MAG: ribosome-binding factor A [Sphingobacteriales bacterium]|jgi:ribosome-binding factor A